MSRRVAGGIADRRLARCGHADRLLTQQRDTLEGLAQALLKAESLDEKEIRGVTGLTVRLPDTRRAWDRSAP